MALVSPGGLCVPLAALSMPWLRVAPLLLRVCPLLVGSGCCVQPSLRPCCVRLVGSLRPLGLLRAPGRLCGSLWAVCSPLCCALRALGRYLCLRLLATHAVCSSNCLLCCVHVCPASRPCWPTAGLWLLSMPWLRHGLSAAARVPSAGRLLLLCASVGLCCISVGPWLLRAAFSAPLLRASGRSSAPSRPAARSR